jgi:hypothetical protein
MTISSLGFVAALARRHASPDARDLQTGARTLVAYQHPEVYFRWIAETLSLVNQPLAPLGDAR